MTGSNNTSKSWARPQLVRVGRIASVQAGMLTGTMDAATMGLMKS